MSLFTNCHDKCCVCYCYGNGCLAGNGDDDFQPATQNQLISRIDNCELDDSNRKYMIDFLRVRYEYDYEFMKNHQVEDEEEKIKLTGEVILDDKTLNALKENVRQEVLLEIRNNGLWDEEVEKFLSEIDNAEGFMNILLRVFPKFLNNIDKEKFHFNDELKYKKLKMCYDILTL